jgi:pimeloyl-ACP methyl ester carboxylesterase
MSDSPTNPRERLLAGLPATEHEVLLAGVSTTVLQGGEGPPRVLLHGPGGSAVHWARVFPALAATNLVIAPDLPGQGSSELVDGTLDAQRVLAWLGDLIDGACPAPPVLIGNALGGAIAARFAAERGDRLAGLVLVDSLGLAPFEPAPDFGAALGAFMERPDPSTHDRLWSQCALDLPALRDRMGERWQAFEEYNLDRARTPTVQAALGSLMEHFVMAPIAAAELDRIAIPTTLIWGRQDLATPLEVAEAIGTRHGWALHVIDDCGDDPPLEQPDAFVRALVAALAASERAAA